MAEDNDFRVYFDNNGKNSSIAIIYNDGFILFETTYCDGNIFGNSYLKIPYTRNDILIVLKIIINKN